MNLPPEPQHFAEHLIAKTSDAVVYADSDGTIRVWNPGAARIFGFTEAEALGRSLDIIIPANLRDRHWHGSARVSMVLPSTAVVLCDQPDWSDQQCFDDSKRANEQFGNLCRDR